MKPSSIAFAAGVGVALLVACGGARAQLIGKVPEATPPTPEYVPPPPPPPPPPRPEVKPEPETPLPSLVKRDAAGKLIRPPEGVEMAALTATEFDPEARAKIDASLAARAADLERMVVEKLDKVHEARAVRETIGTSDDLNQLAKVKDVAQPLATEKLYDRLVRDGALNGIQRSRLEQVVKEYTTALMEERSKSSDTENINRIFGIAARDAFTDITRESMAAYDRLLDRLATASSGQGSGSAEDKAALAALNLKQASLPRDAAERRAAVDKALRGLPIEQQRTALGVVAPAPDPKAQDKTEAEQKAEDPE